MTLRSWPLLAGILVASMASGADDPPSDVIEAAGIAFFETKVRPVLIEHCVSCHGEKSRKGDLRLDGRAAVLEIGGDSGPPVVPGRPEESLLIEAITYESFLQMPPKAMLPEAVIADLRHWIESGAPWPAESEEVIETSEPSAEEIPSVVEARAGHWSYQPIALPAIPEVRDRAWPRNPIDRFILEGIERAGLAPAAEASKATLARRLTFGLTGLPPTAVEIDGFLGDERPDAFEHLVDRLLASPHHGERWGRHWLDLVRFAETSGHEFDYDILGAFRYRDYVIRALNLDLPFDEFVVEHLAGDLLPEPRRRAPEQTNESILGTTFFFLAEGTHSPVDLIEDMRSRVDNQIDVLSKTFLAQTVACARCHDHKFDAISTEDYYALAGYLQSTRHQYASIDPPERIEGRVLELQAIRDAIVELVGPAGTSLCQEGAPASNREGEEIFANFEGESFGDWTASGPAFGERPTRDGDLRVSPDGTIARMAGGWADSGLLSSRLHGVLRSPTFRITKPRIDLLAAGSGGRINVVIDGFEKIRSPIYGDLTVSVEQAQPHWLRIDVEPWIGHDAYLEIADGANADYTSAHSTLRDANGTIAVAEVRFSEHPEAPLEPTAPREFPVPANANATTDPSALSDLIARYVEIERTLPEPVLALGAIDGTGIEVPVHIRGSVANLGDPVPRRPLEVLGGSPGDAPSSGSGRLELAYSIADPANPLTARVMVNRVWAHHFGAGIVATPDDFGLMGQPPTHPELLDWLAREFIRSGWSVKHLHRLIVTSATYRMSSTFDPGAETDDPSNRLLHRMNPRRLGAEEIRDAIQAASGHLNPSMYGPSVPTHLTPFMEGRGRPSESGPIDGDGRRSVYLNIRRNFLSPFLLAFDYPPPATTRGRRGVSNVPAQALALMNDPFVLEQARHWAIAATSAERGSDRSVVGRLYRDAFGREPTEAETTRALRFVLEQAAAYEDPNGLKGWADLCHALLNAKEFRYVD